jgi:hypothetical protein
VQTGKERRRRSQSRPGLAVDLVLTGEKTEYLG